MEEEGLFSDEWRQELLELTGPAWENKYAIATIEAHSKSPQYPITYAETLKGTAERLLVAVASSGAVCSSSDDG